MKRRCRQNWIPAIYANDNQGRWRSDMRTVIAHCVRKDAPGRGMVERLRPESDDYVLLKPKHSAFHATPLDTILSYLGARTVILAGLTTSACILLTPGEVYVRDLKLFVPADCVAGLKKTDHLKALDMLRSSFKANTTTSVRLTLRSYATQRLEEAPVKSMGRIAAPLSCDLPVACTRCLRTSAVLSKPNQVKPLSSQRLAIL